ncbi:MAG: DUF6134 family protein [Pseudomonadota bacterium]
MLNQTLSAIILTIAGSLSCAAQALDCPAPGALAEFVEAAYGKSVEFDVFRNGKKVGKHETRFRAAGEKLAVSSKMNLVVKVLFIPVYAFEYVSDALWCEDGLYSLDAVTDKNGNRTVTKLVRDGHQTAVSGPGGDATSPRPLYPTNHWNSRVLDEKQVLNTITGRINDVTFSSCGVLPESVPPRLKRAKCHAYSGDLEALVWFDDQQRWVGLAFKGDDGSDIVYACSSCERQ